MYSFPENVPEPYETAYIADEHDTFDSTLEVHAQQSGQWA